MNRADEKRAFEAMLAEVEEDSDEEVYVSKQRSYVAPVPAPKSMQKFDAKETNFKSDSKHSNVTASSQYKRDLPQPTKISKEQEAIDNFGSEYTPSAEQAIAEQLDVTKRWLNRACNKNEKSTMECYVERERSSFGLHVVYRCFLEGLDGQTSRFMMSAKKKVAKQTSYYLLSLEQTPDDDRGSENVVGKVRGNAVGSRYIITDAGLAPEKTVAPSMFRKELGVVSFEFDSGGPSCIECWVPSVSAGGVATVWQPDSESNGMEASIDASDRSRIFYLKNKAPKWDEAHGGHVLNFQGRVTESSVKNFQLCWPDGENPEDVVLQFGRVGKHKFTMDLKYPLSPLQAFAVCVACLDGKIADRKGYEYVKKLTGGLGTSGGGDDKSESSGTDSPAVTNGSMKGSSSITGMIRESVPSAQYLRDRIYRSFK